jgi:ubiquinone/menaquinone biosynthesis C-methylase UbiE
VDGDTGMSSPPTSSSSPSTRSSAGPTTSASASATTRPRPAVRPPRRTRLLGSGHLGRVLDVGCGTGYLGLGLAAAGQVDDLHLVDLSPGMLARAGANADGLGVRATFVRASATTLPYPDATFDAVVSRGVLHHLHDVPAALREWRRVVRPGGPVLALSEPTPWADRIGGWSAREPP